MLHFFLELLFPRHCLACGCPLRALAPAEKVSQVTGLCLDCLSSVRLHWWVDPARYAELRGCCLCGRELPARFTQRASSFDVSLGYKDDELDEVDKVDHHTGHSDELSSGASLNSITADVTSLSDASTVCSASPCQINSSSPLFDRIDRYCAECLRRPPAYSFARSLTEYHGVVRQLLLRLKFQSDTSVLPGLQQLLSLHPLPELCDSDLIIPVPLHPRRLRGRGLNQAQHIAALLSRRWGGSVCTNILERTRDTVSQSRLDGRRRRLNLRGAFQLTGAESLAGKKVCLVDDVLTSGSTVNECSRVLLEGGPKEVRVFTFARADLARYKRDSRRYQKPLPLVDSSALNGAVP